MYQHFLFVPKWRSTVSDIHFFNKFNYLFFNFTSKLFKKFVKKIFGDFKSYSDMRAGTFACQVNFKF